MKKYWLNFLLSVPLQLLFIYVWFMAIGFWGLPIAFLFGMLTMWFWQEIQAVGIAYNRHVELESWRNAVFMIGNKKIDTIHFIDHIDGRRNMYVDAIGGFISTTHSLMSQFTLRGIIKQQNKRKA